MRRVERGRSEGPDGRRPQNLWPHRNSGEQRGHHKGRPAHDDEAGGFRRRHRRQPPGCLPLHEGRGPADGEAALWPHREPLQRGGSPRQRRSGELRRQQGGRHRHDEIPCERTGGTEHHRQRRGPRLYRHGYDRRPDGDRENRRPRLHSHGPHGHPGKRGESRGLFSRRGRRLHHRAGPAPSPITIPPPRR